MPSGEGSHTRCLFQRSLGAGCESGVCSAGRCLLQGNAVGHRGHGHQADRCSHCHRSGLPHCHLPNQPAADHSPNPAWRTRCRNRVLPTPPLEQVGCPLSSASACAPVQEPSGMGPLWQMRQISYHKDNSPALLFAIRVSCFHESHGGSAHLSMSLLCFQAQQDSP